MSPAIQELQWSQTKSSTVAMSFRCDKSVCIRMNRLSNRLFLSGRNEIQIHDIASKVRAVAAGESSTTWKVPILRRRFITKRVMPLMRAGVADVEGIVSESGRFIRPSPGRSKPVPRDDVGRTIICTLWRPRSGKQPEHQLCM